MADTRELNDFLIGQFEMFPNFYRPFNNPKKRVRSIKFLPSGDKLVAVTNQRSIELWNCCTASQVNQFNVYKYGISTMDVLDTDETLLIGSHAIKGDYAIRELNMTRKEYTQQFIGHAAPCTSLAVNCEKQYFISVGYDKSMLVFDFRIPDPQISCPNLPSVPLLALHPTTDICALACDNNQIDMMDLRFINGPFCRFKLNTDNVKWTHFKFSPTGEQLLVSSNGSIIRVINSFNGAVQGNYDGRKNEQNIPIDASFTPRSEYILTGSSDGNVLVHINNTNDRTTTLSKVAVLQSRQPEPITAVEMSNKYSLMVTASSYVGFWAPNQS